MKPEKQAPKVVLDEEQQSVFDLLQKTQQISLVDLKTQSGLSNKKWDKTIKHLTKNKLAKVEKTDAGLMVQLIH